MGATVVTGLEAEAVEIFLGGKCRFKVEWEVSKTGSKLKVDEIFKCSLLLSDTVLWAEMSSVENLG